jgi:hypothetical protein
MLVGGAGRDAERVARHISTVRADELGAERQPRILAVADERVAS